jgi:hypothetical protein
VPPRFVGDALRDCLRSWEQGRLDISEFDAPMATSRVVYASLVGTLAHWALLTSATAVTERTAPGLNNG